MVGAATSLALPKVASAARAERTIRFGLTPVFLSNDLDVLDELQSYLAEAVARPVELITQRTYQEVTALLVSGSLDAAWICGYPYEAYKNELALVATPLWRGKPLYQSYLIIGTGRSIHSFEDCRGDIHAFSDPNSNSGYLVTKAYLAERRLSEDTFFRRTFYTYGHRNVIRAVASGLAQSGSVDGYVWEVMRELEPDLVAGTKVLIKSDWYGFPPIAAPARPSDDAIQEVMKSAFLNMKEHPTGRSVLARLRLDGFADLPPAIFDSIAANVDLVRRLG
ncbi:phosphonate transport system substrate-binding protein [Shinella sp. BE166]|uniref:substrate-binding domain-containing protein n=1 Tax=Shinella sp. BE166 TaxID=3373918 RepID=UPI003EB7682E